MAGGAGSLEEQVRSAVRSAVREELSSRSGSQSLVERTRQLINASASSASRALNEASALSVEDTKSQTKRQNSVPSHSLRFKKKAKQSTKVQVVPKSVYLLQEPDIDADEEYSLIDNMIVIKGQCDFYPDYSEEDIRSELVSLFKTKLPLITSRDFDFVRRERNTISVPVVKENHKWNFKHVKHLCGTGRLYVRLNVAQETLVTSDDEEGDEHESTESQTSVQAVNNQPSVQGVTYSSGGSMQVGATDEVECDSSPRWSYQSVDSSFIDNGVESLSSIFTSASRETVRDSLLTYQDIGLAADALSESTVKKEAKDESVHQILNRLKLSMKPYMCSEKLKVDREDIVMDFFQFYKSVHFDPVIPIKVQIKGEPAVDTGGVLRQAFTDVFAELASGSSCLRLFRGAHARLTPVYSTEHVLTGVFEVLGKMIAHSLIQGGPGFPYLTPGIYWYIATGNLSEAVGRSSFVDIGDGELAGFVERVRAKHFHLLLTTQ